MKNAEQTAFPTGADNPNYQGLTKREYFAAMAMQGLLSLYDNSNDLVPSESNVIYMSALSVKAADCLLSELEKQTT